MNENSTQAETITKACDKLAAEMSKLLQAARDPAWLYHNKTIEGHVTQIAAMAKDIFHLKGVLSEINKP